MKNQKKEATKATYQATIHLQDGREMNNVVTKLALHVTEKEPGSACCQLSNTTCHCSFVVVLACFCCCCSQRHFPKWKVSCAHKHLLHFSPLLSPSHFISPAPTYSHDWLVHLQQQFKARKEQNIGRKKDKGRKNGRRKGRRRREKRKKKKRSFRLLFLLGLAWSGWKMRNALGGKRVGINPGTRGRGTGKQECLGCCLVTEPKLINKKITQKNLDVVLVPQNVRNW